MRPLFITVALAATVSAGAGLAQSTTTTVTTTVNPERRAPPTNAPDVSANVFVAPAPGSPLPGAPVDGNVHQWGAQEPVVQTAPPAATNYPPCTNGRADSCYNPDPRKEADVRADGRIGG